ncbi:MAG: DUF5666 domain-containing protein [Vicinamibacteria bacterium]
MFDRWKGLAVAVALCAGLAACGGSGSESVTGSSAGSGGASSTGGATVRGVVETGGAAGSATGEVRALSVGSGIRVSVVGTSLVTTTDDRGQFELRGVPTGRVSLRFEASGLDARLEIESLSEGQSLNVNVHVSSSGAFVAETEDHRNETTIRGAIQAVNGSRLTVLGRVVATDGLTQFLDRNNAASRLADLRVGQVVEVEGTNQSDGSLYARKVKQEDGAADDKGGNGGGADDGGASVNFVGSVQSTSPLVVGGQTVLTDGSTRVLDRKNNPIGLSALKAGDKVEVEGVRRNATTVFAEKIKLQD